MLRDYLLVTKAMADESRIRILKLLEKDELCVCQIMAVIGLSQSTISKHLAILKTAGLVEDRKDGLWVYYKWNTDAITPYSDKALTNIRSWLGDDKKLIADQKKLDEVKKVDLKVLCSK